MSTILNDSAMGDVRNALILARACDLAYYNEPEGPTAVPLGARDGRSADQR